MNSNNLRVLRMVLGGVSQRQVAKALGVSRDTVAVLVRYADSQGWKDLEDLDNVREIDLEPAVLRKKNIGGNRDLSYVMPDYEIVHQELAHEHVTLRMLWEEYVERCIHTGQRYYMETQYRRYYHQYARTQKATIRLEHKPGMAAQVDWAGSHIAYYDEDMGELNEAHLFVAVLPASQLIFADVFRDEKMPSWIAAHNRAFRYFGGVPKTLVPDNLKTGVDKAIFFEPVINRTYQELAEHYGTVILPARVRKPQDKGAVENAVKIASQRILGKLRHHRFQNFFELQDAVSKALEAINSAPLTGKDVSRWDAFLNEEKDYLLTLPQEPYVFAEWSQAKVQPNCHAVYQGHYYSVPFEYVGERVDIRATLGTVELFYHHERVASHPRQRGRQQYVTVADHMPPGKLFFVDWDAKRFVAWAGKIGPACKKVIQGILAQSVIEQHAYRSCFGVLGLKDKYSEQRLEQACRTLLDRKLSLRYSQVKRILEKGEDLAAPKPIDEPTAAPQGFRRGAHYYKKKD